MIFSSSPIVGYGCAANLAHTRAGGGYHRQLGGVEVRIPLPPGVTLAAVTPGTRQIQGFLHVALDASSADASLLVPVRFQLAGSFTAPEPTARFRDQEAAHSYDRARPIQVAP